MKKIHVSVVIMCLCPKIRGTERWSILSHVAYNSFNILPNEHEIAFYAKMQFIRFSGYNLFLYIKQEKKSLTKVCGSSHTFSFSWASINIWFLLSSLSSIWLRLPSIHIKCNDIWASKTWIFSVMIHMYAHSKCF